MKVIIPKVIKIGGVYISTSYENKLMDNHGKYAQSRFSEAQIVLQQRDMDASFKTQCWIHELLHFLDRLYNNYSLEEHEIDSLATGVHTLLVDMGIEFDWSEIK